jgi:hypothetical protein
MKQYLKPDTSRDELRKYGGLLLGLGVLLIFVRKEDVYSDFVMLLLLGAGAIFLYGVGVTTDYATRGVRPWQAVYTVFGLVFVPLALDQFIKLVDGSPGAPLNVFWVYGVTAALAFYAGVHKGIRFGLLAGAIASILAWTGLWDKILSDGIAAHFGVYRGLLGILAILLLVAAAYLYRTDTGARVTATDVSDGGDKNLWRASELITGAGISAVIACSLGISSIASVTGPFGLGSFTVVSTATHWDILLLLISLGLVGLGSSIGTRGPVYVGAIGLFLWIYIVGLDLNENTPHPHSLGLWPIIVLAVGAVMIALSGFKEASLGNQPKRAKQRLRGKS